MASTEITPWGYHEDDPEEFADWDAYERARGDGRRSGIIGTRIDPHRLFRPRWHRLYGDDLPEGMGGDWLDAVPRVEVAAVNPKYL